MNNIKKKKIKSGMNAGVIVTGAALFVAGVIFFWLFFTGGPAKKYKGIENYSKMYELDLDTGLLIFPEKLSKKVQDTEYYCYYQDTFGSPTHEIFLQCTYSEEEYAAELDRLEGAYKQYGDEKRILKREEKGNYPYPAFLAVENHHSSYEYALLTGENEITYISTKNLVGESVHFDKKYLPMDFMTEKGTSFTSGYSIYIIYINEEAADYDYTRSDMVDVVDYEIADIGDDLFRVETKEDSQGRKIITECSYEAYDGLVDDYPEITTYDDLAGYEFKKLTINEKEKKAIVSYLDEGTQKKWEQEIPIKE